MFKKRALWAPLGVLMCVCGLLFAGVTSAAAATDFTWIGTANTELWSTAANWSAGTAPSGAVGTLTFPAVTCTDDAVCISDIDVSGVSMDELAVDDASGYVIKPEGMGDPTEALSIGDGGISATTASTGAGYGTPVLGPIVMTAAQTWNVDGGPGAVGALQVGQITGGQGLHVALTDHAGLTLAGDGLDNEPGALTVTGANSADTGVASVDNGSVGFSSSGGELDTGGSLLTLTDAALIGPGDLGPITVTGGLLGFVDQSPVGVIDVDGNADLDAGTVVDLPLAGSGATVPVGGDFAQLSVTGAVDLSGASLSLVQSTSARCPALTAGDVDTILTASSGITGTFTGLPNGSLVTLNCVGQAPTVKLNYTADALTATVETAGGAAYPTAVQLTGPTTNPMFGQSITFSASVAASNVVVNSDPTGTLTFTDDGQAIVGCTAVALTGNFATAPTGTCKTTAVAGTQSIAATFTSSSTEWADSTSNTLAYTTVKPPTVVVTPGATTTPVTTSKPVTVSRPVTVTKPAVGRPALSAVKLGGTASRRTTLSFRVTAGRNAAKLKSLRISLPRGLSFVRAALKRDLTLGVKGYYTLSRGVLTITTKSAVVSFTVTLRAGAISTTAALATSVKHRKIRTEKVTLVVLSSSRVKTTLTATVKVAA